MPLCFPEDRNCDDMTYQYMFGDNFCVGIFTNEIYLPKGTWTDAWSGEKIVSKGETFTREYPSNRAGCSSSARARSSRHSLMLNILGCVRSTASS